MVSRAKVSTLVLTLSALAAACGDGAAPVAPPSASHAVVVSLEVEKGHGQRFWSGRRSPDAFRVRALGVDGGGVAGAEVRFQLEGSAGGVLSQPVAVTEQGGYAETFLLDSRSGEGTVVAESGLRSARLAFTVDRAPGELRFEEATGAVGLPGRPHPDDLVRVQVRDTEGRLLEGSEVWFVGPERLSNHADTSDAQGWVSTRIVQSQLHAGAGDVWAFVLDFPEVAARTSRPVEPAARRVILVSVDGLRADAAERYGAPTLLKLAREGASSTTARTVAPSLTTPAHLSLLSGVSPETHGIWGEDVFFTPQMAALDPLFRHAGRAGLRAEAFISRGGPLASFEQALQCKLAFGLDALTLVEPDGMRLAGAAVPALRDPGVELIFIHVSDPDVAGHGHGWSSPEYREAVLRADSALARVVQEVDAGTLLIVVSDHGGGGDYGDHLHGSEAPNDMTIPLILWGSRVTRAALGEASILDVPATALWALGFRPPSHYEGQVLLGAFQ